MTKQEILKRLAELRSDLHKQQEIRDKKRQELKQIDYRIDYIVNEIGIKIRQGFQEGLK